MDAEREAEQKKLDQLYFSLLSDADFHLEVVLIDDEWRKGRTIRRTGVRTGDARDSLKALEKQRTLYLEVVPSDNKWRREVKPKKLKTYDEVRAHIIVKEQESIMKENWPYLIDMLSKKAGVQVEPSDDDKWRESKKLKIYDEVRAHKIMAVRELLLQVLRNVITQCKYISIRKRQHGVITPHSHLYPREIEPPYSEITEREVDEIQNEASETYTSAMESPQRAQDFRNPTVGQEWIIKFTNSIIHFNILDKKLREILKDATEKQIRDRIWIREHTSEGLQLRF